MQLLQSTINLIIISAYKHANQIFMEDATRQCARDVFEGVLQVMRFIRNQVRQRRTAGLSLPQFRTLIFLNRAKNSSLSALAEHIGLSPSAMSRLVNGLVRDQLVDRQRVSTNRRQIALILTEEGKVTLEKVRSEIRLRLADTLKNLPPAEQKKVQHSMKLLHGIFDNRETAGNVPP
jgi:DNA-binding MarR family transcriptional regulator